MKKRRGYSRGKRVAVASALLGRGDLGEVLKKLEMRPKQAVDALLAQDGRLVMRDMRMLVVLQKFLRVEIGERELGEMCRGEGGLLPGAKEGSKDVEAGRAGGSGLAGDAAVRRAGGEGFDLAAAMVDLERRMDEGEGVSG